MDFLEDKKRHSENQISEGSLLLPEYIEKPLLSNQYNIDMGRDNIISVKEERVKNYFPKYLRN